MKIFKVEQDTPSILIKLADPRQEPKAFFTRKNLIFDREEVIYDRVIRHNTGDIKLGRNMETRGLTQQTINRLFNGDRMAFIKDGYLLLVSPNVVEVM